MNAAHADARGSENRIGMGDAATRSASGEPASTRGSSEVLRAQFLSTVVPVLDCELRVFVVLQGATGDVRGAVRHGTSEEGSKRLHYRWLRGTWSLSCAASGCAQAASIQFLPLFHARLAQRSLESSRNSTKSDEDGTSLSRPTLFCCREHLCQNWPELRAATLAMQRSPPQHGNPRPEPREVLGEVSQLEADCPAFALPKTNSKRFVVVGCDATYVPGAEDLGAALCLLVQHTDCASRSRHGDALLRSQPGDAVGQDVLSQSGWVLVQSDVVLPLPDPPPPRTKLFVAGSSGQTDPAGRVRAVTFNVLAEIYTNNTESNAFVLPDWALAWSFRSRCMLRELVAYDADVVCLQELQADHYEELKPAFEKLGYASCFKAKTREDMGTAGRIDGCATLFREARFRQIEERSLEYDAVAPLFFSDHTNNPQAVQARKRLVHGNVALLLLLEERVSQRRLLLANTHLFWDPNYADVKLVQALALVRAIERRCGDVAVLIGADLNALPESAVYELLSAGCVRPQHKELRSISRNAVKAAVVDALHPLEHSLGLQSAYAFVQGGEEPLFTNYTTRFKGTLDYLWYSKHHLRPMSVLAVPSEDDLFGRAESGDGAGDKRKSMYGLPNTTWPSDHIPMVAEFEFITQDSAS